MSKSDEIINAINNVSGNKLYLVSYDLISREGKERDYSTIHNKLECLNAKKVLKSQWILNSKQKPKDLYKEIKECLDNDDPLLIVYISKEEDWYTEIEDISAKFKQV